MNSKYFSTRNIPTAFFILSIIYTTLQLFSLQDDLILSSSSLNSSDISSIAPVLQGLYFSITFMILSGLVTLIVMFRTQESTQNNLTELEQKEESRGMRESENKNKQDKYVIELSFIKNKISTIKDEKERLKIILTELCKKLELGQGAIYLTKEKDGKRYLEFELGYAFSIAESETVIFEFGEGLVGQAAKEGMTLAIDDIPDNYINIISGLGSASPNHLLIIPIIRNDKTYGVVELASFTSFDKENISLISESFSSMDLEKSKLVKESNEKETKSADKTESEKSETKSKTKKDANK